MKIFFALLGILWVIIGALLVILTEATRQIFRNLLRKRRVDIRIISAAAFIIGILFLLGSARVSIPWIAVFLGVLAIAKGFFFMFAPKKNARALIDWWLDAKNGVLRIWGIAVFALGIVVLLML